LTHTSLDRFFTVMASRVTHRRASSGRGGSGSGLPRGLGGLLNFRTASGDDAAGGIKCGPVGALSFALIFVGFVIAMHIIGKFFGGGPAPSEPMMME